MQVVSQSAERFSKLYQGEEEDSLARDNLLKEIEKTLETMSNHCQKFKELKNEKIEGMNTEISRNPLALVPVVSCQ